MNNTVLMGRLTRDPDVRYSQGETSTCIARYTLAVDRRRNKNNQDGQNADFIPVVAFGKAGEFIEKYCRKGTKLVVRGRLQSGSYTNKDGVKVYTLDLIAEDQEFAESKASQSNSGASANAPAGNDYAVEGGFMDIPDGIDEELPFN